MRFRHGALGDVSLVVLQGIVELTPTDTIGGALFRRDGCRVPRRGTMLIFHLIVNSFYSHELSQALAKHTYLLMQRSHAWLPRIPGIVRGVPNPTWA